MLFSVWVIFVLLGYSCFPSAIATSMWSRTYGGTEGSMAFSLVATSDGGYAIAGTVNSSGALIKIDAFGSMQWSKTYGGVTHSVIATPDGGYAVAVENILVKTDASGVMQWNKTFGGDIRALVATSDGGYALAGTASSDFWLVKTDTLGNTQWTANYGGPGEDAACALIATVDGGYALAGITGYSNDFWYSYSIFLGGDACLVKTDASGKMQWNRTYGGPADDWFSSLVETPDGGYALAGTFNFTEAFGPGSGDFWLVKTDALGNTEWSGTYGGAGEDLGYTLAKTSDGGYALTGTLNFTGPGSGTADACLVKTDSNGVMQWNQTYGSGYYEGDDLARALIATPDGGYAIAGTWKHWWSWDYTGTYIGGSCWLIKTDENGIVPEYTSLLVPALALAATAFILLSKKRLLHRSS